MLCNDCNLLVITLPDDATTPTNNNAPVKIAAATTSTASDLGRGSLATTEVTLTETKQSWALPGLKRIGKVFRRSGRRSEVQDLSEFRTGGKKRASPESHLLDHKFPSQLASSENTLSLEHRNDSWLDIKHRHGDESRKRATERQEQYAKPSNLAQDSYVPTKVVYRLPSSPSVINCAICDAKLENLLPKEDLVWLATGHMFHKFCFYRTYKTFRWPGHSVCRVPSHPRRDSDEINLEETSKKQGKPGPSTGAKTSDGSKMTRPSEGMKHEKSVRRQSEASINLHSSSARVRIHGNVELSLVNTLKTYLEKKAGRDIMWWPLSRPHNHFEDEQWCLTWSCVSRALTVLEF